MLRELETGLKKGSLRSPNELTIDICSEFPVKIKLKSGKLAAYTNTDITT